MSDHLFVMSDGPGSGKTRLIEESSGGPIRKVLSIIDKGAIAQQV